MKKKFTLVFALLAVAVCLAVLTACGGGSAKITEEKVKSINGTMTYAEVVKILGEPKNKFWTVDGDVGTITWQEDASTKNISSTIFVSIDFVGGKAAWLNEAHKKSSPKEGGSQTVDWEIGYTKF